MYWAECQINLVTNQKRKPDSTMAIEGTEPDYKADEKDVIRMINTLRKMIEEINAKL